MYMYVSTYVYQYLCPGQAETLPFRKSAIGVSLAKSLHEAGDSAGRELDSIEMYNIYIYTYTYMLYVYVLLYFFIYLYRLYIDR
jgi:hypothetical protein